MVRGRFVQHIMYIVAATIPGIAVHEMDRFTTYDKCKHNLCYIDDDVYNYYLLVSKCFGLEHFMA